MRKLYSRFFLGLVAMVCSFASMAQVSVTATAGTTGPTTYTTLRNAFNAINAGTHQGVITVQVTANTTETVAAKLNKSGTGSASYTALTLKPGTGATPTIAGTSDTAVVIIYGDNVTIDGSNNGTTTRNLTISNLDTSKNAALGIASLAANTVNNVTVKNLIASKATIGIALLHDTLGAGRFTNVVLQNNSIQNCYYGIFGLWGVATGNGTGVSITGNDLSSTGTSALFSLGIYVQGADGVSITNNLVGNFNSTQEEDDIALWVASGSKNIVIDGNRITNLSHTGGQGYGAHGIRITSATTSANIRVSNNMIAGISGDGWAYTSQFGLDNPIGILLSASSAAPQSGINIYHNSISMSGNTLNQTAAISVGIYVSGSTTATVVNNIVSNNLGLQAALGYGSVGIYASTGNTQFATLNYNDYYVNPTGTGVKAIGQTAANAYTTLAAWQAAIGTEANSKNVQPNFTSSTDLHLNTSTNAGLDNLGTPVATVTTDIDGNTRSTTAPDMGCDEFTNSSTCTNPVITAQPAALTRCLGTGATFTVTATGTTLTYQWRKGGANISGATSASYTIASVVAGDAANYDVVVSSGTCSVTSSAVALTVSGPCTAVPDVNSEISSVVMTPNVVRDVANVRVTASKAMKLTWNIVDAQGKVVMILNSNVIPGKNDLTLYVGQLSNGTYQLKGTSSKGMTSVVRFVKM